MMEIFLLLFFHLLLAAIATAVMRWEYNQIGLKFPILGSPEKQWKDASGWFAPAVLFFLFLIWIIPIGGSIAMLLGTWLFNLLNPVGTE